MRARIAAVIPDLPDRGFCNSLAARAPRKAVASWLAASRNRALHRFDVWDDAALSGPFEATSCVPPPRLSPPTQQTESPLVETVYGHQATPGSAGRPPEHTRCTRRRPGQALTGWRLAFRSLGTSWDQPPRNKSSRRSPVSGWRQITMASRVGATFRFGVGSTVTNSDRIISGESWEAKRLHVRSSLLDGFVRIPERRSSI